MTVVFQCKSEDQNRFTLPVDGYGTVHFNKGAKITSDKDLIRKLLAHPLKKRGEYRLVTNDELVAKYLDGTEPDKLTEEILNNVTMEGIIELGREINSIETQPVLIKVELEGSPITDSVQKILDFYSKNKTRKETTEEVDVVETVRSGDLKAKDAILFIESSGRDVLEGFLSEDETRVTVLEAYQNRMED